MKACEEYLISMLRDLDGEATSEEAKALHAHLAECTACRELYESYLAIDSGIKATEEEPPEQLTAAIMNCIRREKTQNKPKALLKRFRFTAIAAAAAVIVLVAAKMGSGNSFKSSTIQSFGTAADTEAADMAAPAAAPEVAAEFQENGVAAEEFSEKIEAAVVAPQKETPGPVPNPAAETEEAPAAAAEEDAPMDESEEAAEVPETDYVQDEALKECMNALREAGYSGTVFYVGGAVPDAVKQAFPDALEICLPNSMIVYEIQEADTETVWEQFRVISSDTLNAENQELRYFIYLQT